MTDARSRLWFVKDCRRHLKPRAAQKALGSHCSAMPSQRGTDPYALAARTVRLPAGKEQGPTHVGVGDAYSSDVCNSAARNYSDAGTVSARGGAARRRICIAAISCFDRTF